MLHHPWAAAPARNAIQSRRRSGRGRPGVGRGGRRVQRSTAAAWTGQRRRRRGRRAVGASRAGPTVARSAQAQERRRARSAARLRTPRAPAARARASAAGGAAAVPLHPLPGRGALRSRQPFERACLRGGSWRVEAAWRARVPLGLGPAAAMESSVIKDKTKLAVAAVKGGQTQVGRGQGGSARGRGAALAAAGSGPGTQAGALGARPVPLWDAAAPAARPHAAPAAGGLRRAARARRCRARRCRAARRPPSGPLTARPPRPTAGPLCRGYQGDAGGGGRAQGEARPQCVGARGGALAGARSGVGRGPASWRGHRSRARARGHCGRQPAPAALQSAPPEKHSTYARPAGRGRSPRPTPGPALLTPHRRPAAPTTPAAPAAAALKIACSAHAPRQQVDFVIYKLSKRLNNPSWIVALKALMVFHRLMRECDPSFQEQVRGPVAGRPMPWQRRQRLQRRQPRV
jgi:hypothetical protein